MLVQHYLRRFGRELGREVRELAPEALERLRSYSWPGNIRELQSVIKQALLQAQGSVLLPSFLPDFSGGAAASGSATTAGPTGVDGRVQAFIREGVGAGCRNLEAEPPGH